MILDGKLDASVQAAAQALQAGQLLGLPTEENLSLLQRAFELGEVELLEVFVARENFLRIQAEALDAYRAYFDSVFALESMVGAPISTVAS